MVFSSVIFVFYFLAAMLLGHALCPTLRAKNLWLLVGSLAFYAWGEPRLCVVMLASIAFNHVAGLAVARTRGTRAGRAVLAGAVAANLAALVAFKYTGFLAEALQPLLGLWGWHGVAPRIVMPIGISFFTFQAVSYLIDVARGDVEPERNPLAVALYISFFPQLIAGPIVRYETVADELRGRGVTRADFASGVERFITGLGKKVLIANQLAGPADAIFAMPPGDVGLVAAWTGLVLYTLQIYCDFSGYSDMAIGMGRMFGFHFPENFDHPYAARSVTEFWRRWHISLSTWFRDYLYIPLGGNRRGPLRTYGNLMAVFVLCGLWHGASWTFMLWGLWHGLFLAAERAAGPRLDQVPAPLRHAVTMLAVMLGWVLFRAPDAASAGRYVASIVGAHGLVGAAGWRAYADPALGLFVVVGIACSLPVGRAVHAAVARIVAGGRSALPRHAYAVARLAALGCVFWASAALLFAQTYNPFIYFRF